MKFSVVAFLAVMTNYVAAQDPGQLKSLGFPQCAIPCVIQGNKDAGCAPTDSKCHCEQKAKDAVGECLKRDAKCSQDEIDRLKRVGDGTCAASANGGKPTGTATRKDATQSANPNAATRELAASGWLGLVGLAAFAGL